MKKILRNNYLLLLSRLILGSVFVFAAVSKINDPAEFAAAINNYRLLPLFLINFFAIILPWIELTAGFLIIFGISVKENSFILGIFLIIFITAVSIALFRGIDINCGCFGTSGGSKIGIQKILENIFLLLLSLNLFFSDGGYFTIHALRTEKDIA